MEDCYIHKGLEHEDQGVERSRVCSNLLVCHGWVVQLKQ